MNMIYRLLLTSSLGLTLCTSALAEHHDGHGSGREFHGHQGVAHAVPRAHVEASIHAGRGRYFPRPGFAYHTLPRSYYSVHYHGSPYYFHDGIWYRPGGIGFVVIRPPIGLFIDVLPPFYSTLWFGGTRYYYANDIYYRRDAVQDGYVVSEPPPDQSADGNPSTTSAPPADRVFAYPRNGQSDEQRATDEEECHQWAVNQVGIDPHQAGEDKAAVSDEKRDDFRRAETACLDGRGYSVK